MKLTKKIISDLGGLPVDNDEGGGAIFRYTDGEVDFDCQDLPKSASNLVYNLMNAAYKEGFSRGQEKTKEEMRILIGVSRG